jgi:putative heme-binding domain-containing protein
VQHYIADVRGSSAKGAIEAAWKTSQNSNQQIALLWLLDQFQLLDNEAYSYIAADKDASVRAHALLAVGNSNALSTKLLNAQVIGLEDKDASVKRAAASSARQFRSRPDWLVKALQSAPQDDTLLRQSIRISIRDSMNLWKPDHGSDYAKEFARTSPAMLEPLSVIAAVSESPGAVSFVLALLDEKRIELDLATLDVARMARVVHAESVARLISAIRTSAGNNPEEQAHAIQLLHAGLAQSGKTSEQLSSWGGEVSRLLLESPKVDSLGWTAVPVEGRPASESPWVIAPRPCQDGTNDQPFYYSLPKGEQRTGIYRSAAFEIPAKLSFWCAGHSGFPAKPLNDGNYVRLRDATTHAVLAESRPPRNDTAQRIEWDLKERAGKQGYMELIDGDTADAYAWLAVGRFSLAGLNPSDTARKQQVAAEIVGKLKLTGLKPQLATLVAAPSTDGAARAAIGQALVSLDPDSRAAALVAALNDPSIPDANRVRMGYAITVDSDGEYLDNLREVMKRAPSRLQTTIAETLAGDATGADALLALVESGQAAPRLLLAANVSSKLSALNDAKLAERVSAATAKLPPASETIDKLILQRRLTFAQAAPNLERGQAVFTKHCAACHQVAGQGAVVGPQLDGIGNRGLERIIEDVLDPNRNVDVAFRTTTLRLEDGRVLSGLFRRAEGTQLVFADNQGKEFTVAKDEISQEQKTALSLMPANVPEIVPAEEFNDLVGWLLGQRQAEKK